MECDRRNLLLTLVGDRCNLLLTLVGDRRNLLLTLVGVVLPKCDVEVKHLHVLVVILLVLT